MQTVTLHCDACGHTYDTAQHSQFRAAFHAVGEGWTLVGRPGAMRVICPACRCQHTSQPNPRSLTARLRRLISMPAIWHCPVCGRINGTTPPARHDQDEVPR
ncbi:MAG: hypothetical protein GEV07_30150 [Streptosporangiales bacterium]|nr:hypothetical protein [Streptosporangiales bacterium]